MDRKFYQSKVFFKKRYFFWDFGKNLFGNGIEILPTAPEVPQKISETLLQLLDIIKFYSSAVMNEL